MNFEPTAGQHPPRLRWYADRGKRLVDLALASALLLMFSPIMFLCALAIWLTVGRPVLFPQQRTGHRGTIFTIYKFRTMRAAYAANGRLLSDYERITPLGKNLRRLHLDEVPQLINIVRGEMSLVGPRPLLPEYLERYTPRQAQRHNVRPGLTGWAQVHGANALSWDEKFELDVWYVDHLSPLIDLEILGRTCLIALKSLLSHEPEVLATEFTGSTERTAPESDPAPTGEQR